MVRTEIKVRGNYGVIPDDMHCFRREGRHVAETPCRPPPSTNCSLGIVIATMEEGLARLPGADSAGRR
ncbi:hypothetical protein GCM10012278_79810 [Nonomuraea glycinis]|uniref:Uncharacterized protein n=1 Tax=Nonomuraea glycinis TaxID=2047744 RepID=A0A918EAX7_9ACTN|nr:hypothetical protein GCM10012278_79810 [Nonomuraea glycinis]